MKRTIVRMVSAFLMLVIASQAVAAPRAFKAEASGWLDTMNHSLIVTDGKGTHFGHLRFLGGQYDDAAIDGHVFAFFGFFELYPVTGDVIYLEMTDAAHLDPITGIGIGTLIFVGGTGRFENASGTVEMLFRLSFDESGNMLFEMVMDGSIDY